MSNKDIRYRQHDVPEVVRTSRGTLGDEREVSQVGTAEAVCAQRETQSPILRSPRFRSKMSFEEDEGPETISGFGLPGAFHVGNRPVSDSESSLDDSHEEVRTAGLPFHRVVEAEVVDSETDTRRIFDLEQQVQRLKEEKEATHTTNLGVRLQSNLVVPVGKNENESSYGCVRDVLQKTKQHRVLCSLIAVLVIAATVVGVVLGTSKRSSSADEVHAPDLNGTWGLIGEIEGTHPREEFGYSVALSSNGSILATGARWNNENGNYSGSVRVYSQQESSTSQWLQLGTSINGEKPQAEFGCAVAMSADGGTVVAGARFNSDVGTNAGLVQAFSYNKEANGWLQLGDNIFGSSAGDLFGYSVALSGDGSTLAAGAVRNDNNGDRSGHVRIFSYNTTIAKWVQMGQPLMGANVKDYFGWSVALSKDGSTVAVGAVYHNGSQGTRSGQAMIYSFQDDLQDWRQVGQALEGVSPEDYFGYSVSLSSNGSVLAVGARGNDDNGLDAGQVQVFSLNDAQTQWMSMGNILVGDSKGDHFGSSVSLSADATMLAVGANKAESVPAEEETIENAGQVSLFSYNTDENQWVRVSKPFVGDEEHDELGSAVSLSAEGSTVAAGSYLNDANGELAGQVKVFRAADS